MSLLTPGYFPATYWAENYWADRYWQDYAYIPGSIIEVFMIRKLGMPTTGLSPIVDLFVTAADGASAGATPTVFELGSGYYKFYHDVIQDTVVRVDSADVTMTASERYVDVGVITPPDEVVTPSSIADAVWDEDLSTHTTPGTAGKIMSSIKKGIDAIIAFIS